MTLKTITVGIIVGTFIAWIGWDVYLAAHGAATESMILLQWGEHSVFFPHLLGFLLGHWLFPRKKPWPSGWMFALPIWAILILWDFLAKDPAVWYRFSGWWVLLGIATGSLLWSQQSGDSPL